ncbi:hypothetical protein OAN24_06570 [Pseudodesulfovibrio sp.]|nr:hypothetical protein [Pseudodesulfovibrio sp.]
MNFDTAAKCFEENVRLFANARTEPEKYNLYNGLYNLAEGLRQFEHDLRQHRKEFPGGVNAILEALQRR